jgi:TRAP-type transport system small permease protein
MARLLVLCDRVLAFAACALLAALLVTVLLGVLTRELGDPLIWTDELSRFLMVWLAAFGWILASRRRAHIRIRFFQDKLPKPAYDAVEIALQAAMVLFGGLVCAYGIGLVVKNHDLEATSMPLSMAWLYVPLVPAGLVTMLQGLAELAQVIQRRRAAARGGAKPAAETAR